MYAIRSYYVPLGGIKKIRINVRILAATNRNLEEMVNQGSFRRDLYYRINIVRLALPPLGERKEDIPLLIERFIDRMNRLRGKAVSGRITSYNVCYTKLLRCPQTASVRSGEPWLR